MPGAWGLAPKDHCWQIKTLGSASARTNVASATLWFSRAYRTWAEHSSLIDDRPLLDLRLSAQASVQFLTDASFLLFRSHHTSRLYLPPIPMSSTNISDATHVWADAERGLRDKGSAARHPERPTSPPATALPVLSHHAVGEMRKMPGVRGQRPRSSPSGPHLPRHLGNQPIDLHPRRRTPHRADDLDVGIQLADPSPEIDENLCPPRSHAQSHTRRMTCLLRYWGIGLFQSLTGRGGIHGVFTHRAHYERSADGRFGDLNFVLRGCFEFPTSNFEFVLHGWQRQTQRSGVCRWLNALVVRHRPSLACRYRTAIPCHWSISSGKFRYANSP